MPPLLPIRRKDKAMSDKTVLVAISSKAQAALKYRQINIDAFVHMIAFNVAAKPIKEESDIDVSDLTINKAQVSFVRNIPERRMLVMTQRETAGKAEKELKSAMKRRRNYDYELSIK